MAWKEEYVNYQILERPSRIHNTIYFFEDCEILAGKK